MGAMWAWRARSSDEKCNLRDWSELSCCFWAGSSHAEKRKQPVAGLTGPGARSRCSSSCETLQRTALRRSALLSTSRLRHVASNAFGSGRLFSPESMSLTMRARPCTREPGPAVKTQPSPRSQMIFLLFLLISLRSRFISSLPFLPNQFDPAESMTPCEAPCSLGETQECLGFPRR